MTASEEPDGWRVPINQSSVRPTLVLGAEKIPLVLVAALCALPAATGQLRSIVLGVALWTIALFVFRRLAKLDPILSQTLTRFMNYRSFHSAQPSIIAITAPTPIHQKP